MTPEFDQLAKQIVDSCGLTSETARPLLTQRISEALKIERERFDAKTNEALQLFSEHQLKTITEAYEKASAYTNLVILAGYAGLFALWQFTKEHLSRGQEISVALLTLVSLIIFVIYEVYKAYSTTRHLRDYATVFQDPKNTVSADAVISALESLDAKKRGVTILAYRFWMTALITTTLSGLAAAGVLLYAFVRLLFT